MSTPALSNTPPRQFQLDSLVPPVRGLILDMDGVLWRDDVPIGDLPAIFHAIKSRGLKFIAATNNATRSADQYIQKLGAFGVKIEPWQIITSSDAIIKVLVDRFPQRGRIFVVGETGVIQALAGQGFVVVTDPADTVAVQAVVAGWDRGFTYAKLQRAATWVRGGVPFYGTNSDATFPTPAGLIPGAGSILAAISTAAEATPIVVGKPSPLMLELAAERLQLANKEILAVGDRLETDIAGGQAFGARTALVLSGVSTEAQARAWRPAPDFVAADLAQLVGAGTS